MSRIFDVLPRIGIKNHRTLRLTIRLQTLLVGLVSGYCVSFFMKKERFDLSLAAFGCLIVAAVLEFVVADILAERAFPYETEQKLLKMERQLGADAINRISERLMRAIDVFSGCEQSRISATVHVLVSLSGPTDHKFQSGLLQLTDYVGPYGGKKGRVTLLNQGVIGRCARTHVLECVDFASDDEYRARMVREFGFMQQEAERHTRTGRSYLAFPLKRDNDLVGVLYFFTTEPQVFPLAAMDANLQDVAREIVDDMRMAQLV